jgi:hypothetical protein
MSPLKEFPADQQAVLSLLLRQRKSYADVAALLGIAERAVHDRAHAALAILAPGHARALSAEQRSDIGDYLLSQGSPTEQAAVRSQLAQSAPARDWAHAITHELSPLTSSPLPEIPADDRAEHSGRQTGVSAPSLPSSRRGGALLLAAIAVVIVVAVVLLVRSNDGASNTPSANSATRSSSSKTSTTSTSTGQPQINTRYQFATVEKGSHATGVAAVLTQGHQRYLAFQAQHLAQAKGFSYALWLVNSETDVHALGFLPKLSASGEAMAAEPICPSATSPCLPSNYAHYRLLLLTEETTKNPTRPGKNIVLAGTPVPATSAG